MPWRWPWTRTEDRALFNIGDIPAVQSWSGQSVTPDRALRLSTVFGCVRLLADSVATLPLAVYRGDLFHVKAYPLPGSILGMSPIASAREAVGLGLAAEKFGGQFFGEGAVPSGVLEADQALTREQA